MLVKLYAYFLDVSTITVEAVNRKPTTKKLNVISTLSFGLEKFVTLMSRRGEGNVASSFEIQI